MTDERALTIATKLAGGMAIQAPLGFSAHWFRYRLPLDLLRQGVNTLEVTQVEACPTATFERSINGAQHNSARDLFVADSGWWQVWRCRRGSRTGSGRSGWSTRSST